MRRNDLKFDEVILENLKENDKYHSDIFIEEQNTLIGPSSNRLLTKEVLSFIF